MKLSSLSFAVILSVFLSGMVCAEKDYLPEEGSPELVKKKKKEGKRGKLDPNLPNVLIIGDSISIGYTSSVAAELEGKANVVHNPGNSQGTTNGLANIDAWLASMEWKVIHFNFGLHDLKRVKVAGTAENSNDPDDPFQADLETYSANLNKIVDRLVQSGSTLIFATTTPYPAGVKPYRDPADAARYNAAALEIMERNDIQVNDLHGLVLPDLDTLQKPVNVHFQKEGSELMGKQVAAKIAAALED